MAAYSKILLSGSTNGQPILVVGTSSGTATTIHTNSAGIDEIWLYAYNGSGSSVVLTLCFGGTSTNNLISQSITSQSGLYLVCPGLILNGSLAVKAYAGTTNVITLAGFVNNIA
jgi:hypothetical protein